MLRYVLCKNDFVHHGQLSFIIVVLEKVKVKIVFVKIVKTTTLRNAAAARQNDANTRPLATLLTVFDSHMPLLFLHIARHRHWHPFRAQRCRFRGCFRA